ncbi:MAG: response regulator [Gemmatimonadota bacterium]
MTTPCATPSATSSPAAAGDHAARPQPRVLLVDDTRANLEVLMATLKDECKLGVATSGPKALEYVARTPPDLILLDIMMPEMDGYQVCARLKADRRARDIPVIFITALSEVDEKVKGFEAGAVDYITKPFQPVEVRARVRTHLQLERYRRDLEVQNRALAAAYGQLEQQLRELQGRDRLVRFQMTNASVECAGDEILAVVAQVFEAAQVALYRPSPGDDRLLPVAARKATAGPAPTPSAGSPAWLPALSTGDPTSLAARAWRERGYLAEAGAAAAARGYGDEALGGVRVSGIGPRAGDDAAQAAALNRLAAEAAVVLRTAEVTEDLDAGRLSAEDLIALSGEEGDS